MPPRSCPGPRPPPPPPPPLPVGLVATAAAAAGTGAAQMCRRGGPVRQVSQCVACVSPVCVRFLNRARVSSSADGSTAGRAAAPASVVGHPRTAPWPMDLERRHEHERERRMRERFSRFSHGTDSSSGTSAGDSSSGSGSGTDFMTSTFKPTGGIG